MKHVIISLSMILASVCVNAEEVYSLKFDATVNVFGENGKPKGTKKLKSGTKIVVYVPEETVAPSTDDISPVQYMDEMPRTPVKFWAKVEMDANHWSSTYTNNQDYCSTKTLIYNKDKTNFELIYCFADKRTKVGRDFYNVIKDGNNHFMYLTLKYRDNEEKKDTPEVIGFTNIGRGFGL